MNNFSLETEAMFTAQNDGYAIKQECSPELEELITYLVNYLKPQVLSDLQEQVLRGAWQGKTYLKSHKRLITILIILRVSVLIFGKF